MMSALYHEEGSSFRVEILREPEVTDFIDTHAAILDSAFEQTEMSAILRSRLRESDWMFSGFKTFHELKEAFPSLLDDNGVRKPFEQFLKDVQSIDDTYNRNYLRAEYNFAMNSAEMAARWEEFEKDEDEYYLQYRTAGDDNVRPEHAALRGVTLPRSDKFWKTYYPPNGWNCRCTVVQVLRDGNRATDHDEAMARGAEALSKDKKGMFAFNSGTEQRTFPAYNPYTISKCATCDKAKLNLAKEQNELCAGCAVCVKLYEHCKKAHYTADEKHSIYSRPIAEQFVSVFKEGEAEVLAHILKSHTGDYNRVLEAAKLLAQSENLKVSILPEIHIRETDIRKKLGLPIDEGVTPDLMTDIGSFIDVKSPNKVGNISRNAGEASRYQHAIAYITDDFIELEGSEVNKYSHWVFKNSNYTHDTVFFKIDGVIYKKTRAKP